MSRVLVWGVVLLCAAYGARGAQPDHCDRECLEQQVDQYLAALVARDPSKVAISPGVRYTENTVPLHIGQGLWATATGLGHYKQYFLDPQAGQAAFVGTALENGNGIVLALRLRVQQRRISEAESIVVREPAAARRYEALGGPHPIWNEILPRGAMQPRETLSKITNSYFESILHSDGALAPFDSQCIRSENGFFSVLNSQTAEVWSKGAPRFELFKLGCAQQMDTGIWKYIGAIRERRFPVIDIERGISVAFVVFDHPGTVPYVDVPNFGRVPTPEVFMKPTSMIILESFKIIDGKIREVAAEGTWIPYGQKTTWDPK